MTEQTFDTIKVNRTGRVITVELNRPDALNALNSKMTEEVTTYLTSLDEDKDTGCFVLTGTGKAFAAGAVGEGRLLLCVCAENSSCSDARAV